MSFNSRLTALIKKDRRFVDEDGELIIAAVQNHAWRIDHWVFNLNTFIEYVSQKKQSLPVACVNTVKHSRRNGSATAGFVTTRSTTSGNCATMCASIANLKEALR